MPKVIDVTEKLLQDASGGPGERSHRVAKAKPAKQITPTLQQTLDEWNRKSDRSLGFTSKALAYGFDFMKPSTHTNMIRLLKGGHLKACQVEQRPPQGSNAHRHSPYGDRYYLIRESCPAEIGDGQLYGRKRRR